MDGLRVLDALSRTLGEGAPLVTPPLCLATRYRTSSCRRCQSVCPAAVIEVSPWLKVDDDLCQKCGACAAVCPTGALDAKALRASLRRRFGAAVAKGTTVVVACERAALPKGDPAPRAAAPCLAALAAGDVVAARRIGIEELVLAHGDCAGCGPRSSAERACATAREAASALTAAGAAVRLSEIDCQSREEESEPRPAAMSRRGLFATLVGGVGEALAEPGDGAPLTVAELHAQYRPPRAHTALLADLAALAVEHPALAPPSSPRLGPPTIALASACDGCGLCARYCPHAAIAVRLRRAVVDRARCTGCGLCAEVCPLDALALESGAVSEA
jgi:ferredoxin